VRDVTERKELEAQLRQSQKMEGIGQLAGGVAHDFNNLLTVISGAVGLLQEDLPAGHASLGLVDEIGKAGERASSLTRQLLAFSRKQVLKLSVLDLNQVVAGMEKMLHRLIGEDIRLSTKLDPSILKVKADGAQLEHVIVNLAVNARDAMPKGGALTLTTGSETVDEHTLAARPELVPGTYSVLAVTDTGSGIPPEVMARIFEPFFTTKQPGKGTGLGLATVYGVLKQLGGYVSVESTVGKGTTFKIHLPCAELGAAVAAGSEALPPDPGGKGEIVLLVEDDDGVRALESQVLRRRGYVVLEARDGLEALRISGSYQGQIHLLATDVVMPNMNGRELAEQLGAQRPALKVLFLSGHTEDATLRAGLVEERMTLLQKPFVPDTLARKVSEVLQA
jgi:nitrogen-specific signal transduction histidine kinase/CheY-like chemotaxis protein